MKKLKSFLSNFWKKFKRLPNNTAVFLVNIYRAIFSPSVGLLRYLSFYPKPSCIFYPTCSEYTIECFKKYSFFKALSKTAHRIGRCHPKNDPMVDLP